MSETTRFKLGRLPKPADEKNVRLTPHLKVAKVAPVAVDYYSHVTSWPMYLNDQLGDCTCAGDGHIVNQQTALGDGKENLPTDQQILKAYEQSGYKPGQPNTDQGWTVQAALEYLRKTGLNGFKIAAYGDVNVKDHNEVKLAIAEFGALSLGINCPESAQDQFPSGVWTVVPNSPIEGGHCIVAVGYDADYVNVVTWGACIKMTWEFWDTYVDQALAVISKDFDTLTKLDLSAFGDEFAALFNTSNPFAAQKSLCQKIKEWLAS